MIGCYRHETCCIVTKYRPPTASNLCSVANKMTFAVLYANKGNATVILKVDEYYKKMRPLLEEDSYWKM